MEKWIKAFFMGFGMIAFVAVINLLLAFPLKWTWNYVMPYLFNLPTLSWGQAWCLAFVAGFLVKSVHTHN